jgi:hypothetical protein
VVRSVGVVAAGRCVGRRRQLYVTREGQYLVHCFLYVCAACIVACVLILTVIIAENMFVSSATSSLMCPSPRSTGISLRALSTALSAQRPGRNTDFRESAGPLMRQLCSMLEVGVASYGCKDVLCGGVFSRASSSAVIASPVFVYLYRMVHPCTLKVSAVMSI